MRQETSKISWPSCLYFMFWNAVALKYHNPVIYMPKHYTYHNTRHGKWENISDIYIWFPLAKMLAFTKVWISEFSCTGLEFLSSVQTVCKLQNMPLHPTQFYVHFLSDKLQDTQIIRLLTEWSKVPLGMLQVTQLTKNCVALYRTWWFIMMFTTACHINPSNAELNPICHLLALLGAHHILHVSRIRVNTCVSGCQSHWKPSVRNQKWCNW